MATHNGERALALATQNAVSLGVNVGSISLAQTVNLAAPAVPLPPHSCPADPPSGHSRRRFQGLTSLGWGGGESGQEAMMPGCHCELQVQSYLPRVKQLR